MLILLAVAIAWIEDILWSSVYPDVGFRDKVYGHNVAARLAASYSAIQLIYNLPALLIQRLWNGRHLMLSIANTSIGRDAAIASGDEVGGGTLCNVSVT